jgi:CBS-domain-containing membrane protein
LLVEAAITSITQLERVMKASDVMVSKVITTHPQASVSEAAKLLVDHDISALPVVNEEGRVVGAISEADIMRRAEIGTEKRARWWLEAVTPGAELAAEYARSHGKKVKEITSTAVISATEDTPLEEIASLLEKHRIKRVPILKDGRLVGIVSRSNLVQALAAAGSKVVTSADKDRIIREDIIAQLANQKLTDFGDRNVLVVDGVVHLWGLVGSPKERKALTTLAESAPGVAGVRDEMIPAY